MPLPLLTPSTHSEKMKERERKVCFDERHWSEKTMDQMMERDWRIFREDFGISTKGGRVPHPIRYWEEAAISPDILKVIQTLGYTVSLFCTSVWG